jgi:hypothetical protein
MKIGLSALMVLLALSVMGADRAVIARNTAPLTVQVVGAQGQSLSAALVEIKNSAGTTVYHGLTDDKGIARAEVAYDSYSIYVDYKGFTSIASTTVNSPAGTEQIIVVDVYVELFGYAMTFATFVILVVILIVLVLIIAYVLFRRRSHTGGLPLPPPPPPPPPPP